MVSVPRAPHTGTLSDWLILHHAPGIGAVTCERLLAELGSPAAIRNAPAGQLQSLGLRPQSIEALHVPDPAQLERELTWLDAPDNHIICLADNAYPPQGAPPFAMTQWGELRKYYGIPEKGPLSPQQAKSMIHGYLAAVSYVDAQIGRLLDELERLELADKTIVNHEIVEQAWKDPIDPPFNPVL